MGGDHPSALWTWSHFGVAQSVSDRAIAVGSPDQHLVISRTVCSGMADDVTREANQRGRPADLAGAGAGHADLLRPGPARATPVAGRPFAEAPSPLAPAGRLAGLSCPAGGLLLVQGGNGGCPAGGVLV